MIYSKVIVSVGIAAICLFGTKGLSQISSPGMGDAKTASWFALGLKQDFGREKKWESVSYIGLGRKSNPDEYNLVHKPSIFVINQEFFHQFHNRWQYSLGFSYRKQHEYTSTYPYVHKNPEFRQELRSYGRIRYSLGNDPVKATFQFREEFRKFYGPRFRSFSEDLQFRSRLRMQLTWSINSTKTHRLIASAEALFSISKKHAPEQWTTFAYRESRFSLYYSLHPSSVPITFNIGYMNNLLGNHSPHSVHYLAFDIIFTNVFSSQKVKSQ